MQVSSEIKVVTRALVLLGRVLFCLYLVFWRLNICVGEEEGIP